MTATHLVPLNGIHFLIHPMYDAFVHTNQVQESEYALSGGWRNGYTFVTQADIESDLKHYPPLVSAYLERARAVGSRELLLTFLPIEQSALQFTDPGFEPHYERLLRGLKRALHDRFVLFYVDTDPVNDADASQEVHRQLAARGWEIPPNMPSYAFGETLDHCLPRAVRTLRQGLGLTKLTHVHPYFTDLHFSWPTLSERERQRIRDTLRDEQLLLREWPVGR